MPVRSDVSLTPDSLNEAPVTLILAIGAESRLSTYTSRDTLGFEALAVARIPLIPLERSTFFITI